MVKPKNLSFSLLIGDAITLLLVTLVGFLSHNSQVDLVRFLATALPLILAWGLTSPWLGLLESGKQPIRQIWWKVLWAVTLSTPFALLLRGWILNSAVQVPFALVMVATSAAGMLIWRLVYAGLFNRNQIKHSD
ncbi:MAG: hypothetical protein CVU39_15910 [Chloroflexi bacterium HGW-Chloroflexi-10]|nr:MAG: hypothetical protein CVU39_15910 [Chloroflexi bacterium HGW-Chloroflexi-10]